QQDERLKEIARDYIKQPEGTLVVSPDNRSRMEINRMIHTEMQKIGQVDHRERNVRVLVARQEITGADRQWAEQYEPGNIVRYTKGSKTQGIEAGEYSRVESVNAKENLLTVRRESGEKISYDPRRLQGVTLYRETERAGEKLVNRRLAYVAVSRGRYDAQIYTNDKTHLTEQLSRDVSHRSAIEPSRESAPSAQKIESPSARSQVHEHIQAVGHSISR